MKNTVQDTIIIYEGKQGKMELRADIAHETVWATQAQIADLFEVNSPAVSKHIKNIFKEEELDEISTVSKMETVRKEGSRAIKRNIEFYNLDIIIAVGYRVNSKKATQFRIWATSVLKDHLLKGYTINKKRLAQTQVKIEELNKTIHFITQVRNKQLSSDEASGLLSVIKDYADSWLLLQKYDEDKLTIAKGVRKSVTISYEEAAEAVAILKKDLVQKKEAGDLFGQERGEAFRGIVATIYQTYSGKELYPTIEEKAAHLLYFIIKDHPFSDGNKRSGALLFIRFLQKNNYLYANNGERKINDNALVALALLVAESNPKEKDQLIALITQLLQ